MDMRCYFSLNHDMKRRMASLCVQSYVTQHVQIVEQKCTPVSAAVRLGAYYAQSPSDAASTSFGTGRRLAAAAESLKSSWSAM